MNETFAISMAIGLMFGGFIMNETFAIAMAIGLIFGSLGCFIFNGNKDDTDDAWEE